MLRSTATTASRAHLLTKTSFHTVHIYDTAHPGAHRALRILVTAALAGLKVDLADGYEHGKTNKTPEFLAKFPTGQVFVVGV